MGREHVKHWTQQKKGEKKKIQSDKRKDSKKNEQMKKKNTEKRRMESAKRKKTNSVKWQVKVGDFFEFYFVSSVRNSTKSQYSFCSGSLDLSLYTRRAMIECENPIFFCFIDNE